MDYVTITQLRDARAAHLTRLKQAKSRDTLDVLMQSYRERLKSLMLDALGRQLKSYMPKELNAEIRRLGDEYVEALAHSGFSNPPEYQWDRYMDKVAAAVDQYMIDVPDSKAEREAVEEAVKVPPPPVSVKPAITITQKDASKPPAKQPLKLQFDEKELEYDADDPPPAPTPSPSQATYKKRLQAAQRNGGKNASP